MHKGEVGVIYTAGLAQGLALVAFPAASSILTNPNDFNLSSTHYGSLFIPQSILAIAASLLSTKLNQRINIKFVFTMGLVTNLLSMALLATSRIFMKHYLLAYGLLMLATSCLGLGFGFTVPSLNTLTALLFPKKVDSAILVLNALLGLGTALAPVLVTLFTLFKIWWGLPILLTITFLSLLFYSFILAIKNQENRSKNHSQMPWAIPSRFWIYAGFALFYGVVETINGNWAIVYMKKNLQTSTTLASVALACFWGMVTLGRILFALIKKPRTTQTVYRILPFIIAFSFMLIFNPFLRRTVFDILAFGLAGLGCSALLPLTISFGTKELTSIRNSIAGGIIGFYLLGYGIGAFGVGALEETAGLSLKTIFGLSTIIALSLGILSFFVTYKQNEENHAFFER